MFPSGRTAFRGKVGRYFGKVPLAWLVFLTGGWAGARRSIGACAAGVGDAGKRRSDPSAEIGSLIFFLEIVGVIPIDRLYENLQEPFNMLRANG
jgi:hypothetical protein